MIQAYGIIMVICAAVWIIVLLFGLWDWSEGWSDTKQAAQFVLRVLKLGVLIPVWPVVVGYGAWKLYRTLQFDAHGDEER